MPCPHCGSETICEQPRILFTVKRLVWGAVAVSAVALGVYLVNALFEATRPSGFASRAHDVPQPRSFLQSRQELMHKYGQPISKASPMQIAGAGAERLNFRSDRLTIGAEVVQGECHYLSYKLTHKWTDDQITVALSRNGKGWTRKPSLQGALLAPVAAQDFYSTEGHHARYSPAFNHLQIWSGTLLANTKRQAEERRRAEAEIPNF
jgi:hypothetical protein